MKYVANTCSRGYYKHFPASDCSPTVTWPAFLLVIGWVITGRVWLAGSGLTLLLHLFTLKFSILNIYNLNAIILTMQHIYARDRMKHEQYANTVPLLVSHWLRPGHVTSNLRLDWAGPGTWQQYKASTGPLTRRWEETWSLILITGRGLLALYLSKNTPGIVYLGLK